MKKYRYIKPETTVIDVEPEAMMAASNGTPNSIDVTFDTGGTDIIGPSSSADAKKHYNAWGFDEEED